MDKNIFGNVMDKKIQFYDECNKTDSHIRGKNWIGIRVSFICFSMEHLHMF